MSARVPVQAGPVRIRPGGGPTSFAEVRALRRQRAWFVRIDALLVGIAAAAIGAIGAGAPSFWYDEAASISSANRPVPEMLRLLGTVDAVHGLYYLLLHAWFAVAGISEWSARVPSVLAVGVAAAGVVVLGNRLSGRRPGLTAGLVFAILPRTTWAATEARSSALTAAAAVWLTVLLVAALRRRSWAWWAAYALAVAGSVVLFLYLGTLVAAQLVAVALVPRWRSRLGAALLAAGAGLAATIPFVQLTVAERAQVEWIPPLGGRVASALVRDQWFLDSTLGAVVGWLVVVAAVVVGGSRMLAGVLSGEALRPQPLTVLAVACAVLPTALVLGWSAVASPVYLDRYLTFTAPAAAILLATALLALARTPLVAAGLAGGLVLAFLPGYLGQRTDFAKPVGMDYSAVADVLARRAAPGDCVLFGWPVSWNPTTLRTAAAARPDAVAGLDDVGRARTATEAGTFWDESLPLEDLRLETCSTAWLLADADRETTETLRRPTGEIFTLGAHHVADDPEYRAALAAGFRETERTTLNLSQVVRLDRG